MTNKGWVFKRGTWWRPGTFELDTPRIRIDYTVRVDGLEMQSCHYCDNEAAVIETTRRLEELGAWDIRVAGAN